MTSGPSYGWGTTIILVARLNIIPEQGNCDLIKVFIIDLCYFSVRVHAERIYFSLAKMLIWSTTHTYSSPHSITADFGSIVVLVAC